MNATTRTHSTPATTLPIRSANELAWWISNGPFFGFRDRFAVSFRNDRDEWCSFAAVLTSHDDAGQGDGVPIVAVQLNTCVLGDEVNRPDRYASAIRDADGVTRPLSRAVRVF